MPVDAVERWLERERDAVPLWIPVAIGTGIGAWFWLPGRGEWIAAALLFLGLAAAGVAIGTGRRSGRALIWFGMLAALGLALIWGRATWIAAPVLERAGLHRFDATVARVQPLPARDSARLVVRPDAGAGLPPAVRVTVADKDMPGRVSAGDRIRIRAWMMPPAAAPVPGGYDFARRAWFDGLGATGRALPPVVRLSGDPESRDGIRQRLNAHVRGRLEGPAGAVGSALVTGDQGAIADEDAEAMRRSGLAHLLSISGLHVTAAVGAAMLIVLRLLALSPTLALRWPLLLIAAGAGALTGIGYTLLAGGEVPTIRSCIAALLVLAGLAMGRDAMTLRLVAAGAAFILLIWPEALVGASFQLSFAAVTAIVALHSHPRVRSLLSARDERWPARLARTGLSLLLTGLAVELVLMPIAIYHFHKAGLYGALANIVAIPLTTFVVMPLEAAALVLDAAGLGAPFWWLAGLALNLLLWIAHAVASAPGSVAALPTMPTSALALSIAGGLWMLLWQTRVRWLGLLPLAAGMLAGVMTPPPDLLVTGDGRHLLVRMDDGEAVLLRGRAGDYVRDMLGGAAGEDGALGEIAEASGARCSEDSCWTLLQRGGRTWRILATRSGTMLPWGELVRACGTADVVISDRRLPPQCRPRWLKLDRPGLRQSGGLAISLDPPRVTTVIDPAGEHPWIEAVRAAAASAGRSRAVPEDRKAGLLRQ
nr:ComEC/Rec2 family competence protein [Sphingomonas jejuensis]